MAVDTRFCPDSDGENASRSLDPVIAALAARQHGAPARRGQRGVFAVGHRVLTRHGVWMAAVMAGGDGAVLSHRSAAALWRIRDSARKPIEVTVPRHRGTRPAVHYHRAVLPSDETTIREGIPTTDPARTLFDLASVVTPQQLEHALNEAEIRRLTSPLPLDALIARHPRRKGTTALKRALEKQRQRGRPSSAATSRPRSSTSPSSTACRDQP